jgi:hypothetical protein
LISEKKVRGSLISTIKAHPNSIKINLSNEEEIINWCYHVANDLWKELKEISDYHKIIIRKLRKYKKEFDIRYVGSILKRLDYVNKQKG